MNILGVSFLSDASAVVVQDGELISAISEERINRIKLWNGIPRQAIKKALELAGLTIEDIDIIATHGSAPDEVDPAEKCCVCPKKRDKVVAIPCGHVGYCTKCLDDIRHRRDKCVICGEEVNSYVNIKE